MSRPFADEDGKTLKFWKRSLLFVTSAYTTVEGDCYCNFEVGVWAMLPKGEKPVFVWCQLRALNVSSSSPQIFKYIAAFWK